MIGFSIFFLERSLSVNHHILTRGMDCYSKLIFQTFTVFNKIVFQNYETVFKTECDTLNQ